MEPEHTHTEIDRGGTGGELNTQLFCFRSSSIAYLVGGCYLSRHDDDRRLGSFKEERDITKAKKTSKYIFCAPFFSGKRHTIDSEIGASKTEVKAFITHTLVAGL